MSTGTRHQPASAIDLATAPLSAPAAAPPGRGRARTAAAANQRPRPDIGTEVGFTGTRIFSGLVIDDYNPALRWPRSIDVYEKMRNDGQVQAVETVISLPIRTVRFYVEPSDSGASAQEAADLVDRNLLQAEWMSHSFDDLVRKAIISTMMGFQLFEKVLDEQDGYIVYRKLADRHPRTVSKWLTDETGGIAGIEQQGYRNSAWEDAKIPASKLLRFTFREQWGNPEGFPLARVMYENWYFKHALYAIAGIGAERDWVGTPVGTAPAGASQEDRENYLRTLQNLATHENGALVLPAGYGLESYHGVTKTDAILGLLDHHDMTMARVALATFLNLVGQARGGAALSDNQSQFFLLSEQAHATWLVSVINQFAVKPLCDWNFPGIRAYPKIRHNDVSTVLSPIATSHALAALVNKELLTPDLSIEDRVRAMMSLPDIPEDQRQRYEDRKLAPKPVFTAPGSAPERAPDSAGAPPGRASSGSRVAEAADGDACSCHRAEFTPSPGVIDRWRRELLGAEDRFTTDGRILLEKIIGGFERAAGPIVDQAVKSDDLSRGKAHLALAALKMPYRGQYQSWLRDFLMSVVIAGAQAAAEEASGSPDAPAPTIPNELRSFVACQASILSEKHLADLKFAAISQAQRDLDARLGRDALMCNVRDALRQQASANLQASLSDAVRAVTDQLSAAVSFGPPLGQNRSAPGSTAEGT